MDVKISDVLNPEILNSEWVGFQGDSEYVDEQGNVQMGYWSFVDIIDDPQDTIPWELGDEVPEESLYKNYRFIIKNKKDHICVVKFHYRGEDNDF